MFFFASLIPSPGGRVARQSRVGRGIRAATRKPVQHNRPPPELPPRQHPGGGLHIFQITTLPPAFLISHPSVPKSRWATARNCGVIAPGNHWILDSLRGAPPPGEAMGAAAPEVLSDRPIRTPREGCPYNPSCKNKHVIANQCAHWCTPGWLLLPYGQFTFWQSPG